MSIASDIIRARDAGVTRVVVVRNYASPLELVMKSLGLEPNPSALAQVSPQVAANSVAALLWKDLAYSYELMPLEKARSYGQAFVGQYESEDVTFYANADWNEYHQNSSFCFTPLTPATFSAVVMVVHSEFAACLVVEDED